MDDNEKIFFKDILRMSDVEFLEIRIMNIQTKKWFSKYVNKIEELEQVLYTFDTPDYNIYYGTNVRTEKGRKTENVKTRKFFYIDIEKDGEKPKISNVAYQKNLKETMDYICHILFKKYGIKPSVLYVSGRGYHLGFSHYDLPMEYDNKFKHWFKEIQLELEKNKPHLDIKCSDPVRDAVRIGGCPGTINYKYSEKPYRSIEFINPKNIFDMQNILDNHKFIEYKKRTSIKKNVKILESPEFKVFELKIPANKGFCINNKLRLALNLLMDATGFSDRELISRKIESMGYDYKTMLPINNPEYVYNEAILNNWVMDFWEFCLEKQFKLPYPLVRNAFKGFVEKPDWIEYESSPLETPWDVYYFAKSFNIKTHRNIGRKTIIFPNALEKHIFKNITNDKLRQWIELNDFVKKVKVLL